MAMMRDGARAWLRAVDPPGGFRVPAAAPRVAAGADAIDRRRNHG